VAGKTRGKKATGGGRGDKPKKKKGKRRLRKKKRRVKLIPVSDKAIGEDGSDSAKDKTAILVSKKRRIMPC